MLFQHILLKKRLVLPYLRPSYPLDQWFWITTWTRFSNPTSQSCMGWTIHLLLAIVLKFDGMPVHPVSWSNLNIVLLLQPQQDSIFSSGVRGFTGDNYLATSAASSSLPSLTDSNMIPLSYAWQGSGVNLPQATCDNFNIFGLSSLSSPLSNVLLPTHLCIWVNTLVNCLSFLFIFMSFSLLMTFFI